MTTFAELAGWSALVAAVATVVGAALLMLFFARGEPWGTLNDVASVILMVATIPVAIVIGAIELERFNMIALVVAAIGVMGMLLAAGFQGALVARVRTYEQLLSRTLGAGAVVGVWYVLAGLLALEGRLLPPPLPPLAIASGVGFIAIGYGFAAGGQNHSASKAGGVVLLLGSTSFLGLIGFRLLIGDLVVPVWNL
ncbi:MAG: hypothetical protein HY264_10410 [Chloroflexi bacterium]|nr:hypothetical protein [Chloroflexota bacterium]